MADNAIQKLFDEIRAAEQELEEAFAERSRLSEQQTDVKKRIIAADERTKLLDATLRKHIRTGMPIVQAKMQAHEEQQVKQEDLFVTGVIGAGKIQVSSIGAISGAQLTGTMTVPKLNP